VHVAVADADREHKTANELQASGDPRLAHDLLREHIEIESSIFFVRINQIRLREILGMHPATVGRQRW
jgi:hypothetical protein